MYSQHYGHPVAYGTDVFYILDNLVKWRNVIDFYTHNKYKIELELNTDISFSETSISGII